MSKRKIIKISATAEKNDGPSNLFALCDDGSVFKMRSFTDDQAWIQIPAIPEDVNEKCPSCNDFGCNC